MKAKKIQAAIIGAGHLAWSLIPNLQRAGVEVVQLITRDPAKGGQYGRQYGIPATGREVGDLSPLASLVFLTVSDQAIAGLARELARHKAGAMVVHTSGSTGIDALAPLGENSGVLYPLQTFTRDAETDLRGVPVFLEGAPTTMAVLRPLAARLSERVYVLDSEDRLRLHLGAVMVNNFTNYLYRLAAGQLPDVPGLDFRIYEALIREHIEKVFRFLPDHTQTGPAARGDQTTLKKHLRLLADAPALHDLYRTLSEGIAHAR